MQSAVRGRARSLLPVLVLWAVVAWPIGATVPTAKPEDVGLSSERLRRIGELIQRNIDARTMSGAVTLVARYGRVAHFEAQGLMDLESRKPIAKDTIFRIMSMTKPVVGVAILMLVEEGKVRLGDPASKFIPELKDVKVAIARAGQTPPAASSTPSEIPFDTVAVERDLTIRDLLTHTSGLMSGPISNRESGKVALKPQETLADFLPRLRSVPLEFQPGSRWAYRSLSENA
jgi:CubicO group peptidase (beta-lactamase class C family)